MLSAWAKFRQVKPRSQAYPCFLLFSCIDNNTQKQNSDENSWENSCHERHRVDIGRVGPNHKHKPNAIFTTWSWDWNYNSIQGAVFMPVNIVPWVPIIPVPAQIAQAWILHCVYTHLYSKPNDKLYTPFRLQFKHCNWWGSDSHQHIYRQSLCTCSSHWHYRTL